MIISHKHKFIFFAIPKTGTHSVRFALRPFFGEQDEEHVHLFKQSKVNFPQFQNRLDGHFSVREIKPHISDEMWKSYFKFCFVRNPWDKFISTVFYRNRGLINDGLPKIDFFNSVLDKHQEKPGLFYQPQSSFLLNENEDIAMDFIGKTESMQEDFDEICKKIHLPRQLLDQKNSSPHAHYATYYDTQLKNRVADFYQHDIETFNYTFANFEG